MTIDSTKYFCKRGAVSARLNLVDTPLRGEYYYDGEHEKYYFGARYYDPFFGMWMSPDPASQFANPYSYGGDPLNYIDPTGMWAIGLGLVVGWDNKSGWSFGVGAAADFEIIGANFSYTFNQDGSKSLNLGVNADIPIQTPWVYLEINMGLGFSMNSYSGATLSTHGGLCVGEVGLCGGVENGGSLYWDRGGSFMGATVYAGVYASLGYGMARVSAGYEAGLFGMEGRGLYAGANVGKDGASLYASWAENGGWNYGGGYRFEAWRYDGEKLSLLSNLISFTPFLLAADVYDKENNITRNVGELIKEDGDGVVSVVIHGNQDGTVLWEGVNYTPEEFFEIVLKNEITNKTTLIDLYTCLGGYGGENSIAQKLANVSSVKVRAATGYVRPIIFNVLGMVIGSFDKDRLVGDSKIDGNVVVKDPKWMYFNAK